jgi:hypothetical protein
MRKLLPIVSMTIAFLTLNLLLVSADSRPSQMFSESQLIEIGAIDSGWYTDSGFHGPDNTNYVVGECYLPQCPNLVIFRNFFVFNLSGISGEILSASLVIENPMNGYNSNDPSETWTIFEVNTPISALVAGGSGLTDIYEDLGSGPMFGNAVVTPTSSLVQVDLNQAGIDALNAKIGEQFAIGGAITTLDNEDNNETVFGNSNEVNVRKLLLYVSTPLTMTINYPDGSPGSYFNVSGSGFPSNEIGTLAINSTEVATVTVDNQGMFTFTLDTVDADIGHYFVTVDVNPSATVAFSLTNESPFRDQVGSYTVYVVPAGIAITNRIYLPLITH